jgi:hypothetical protein
MSASPSGGNQRWRILLKDGASCLVAPVRRNHCGRHSTYEGIWQQLWRRCAETGLAALSALPLSAQVAGSRTESGRAEGDLS